MPLLILSMALLSCAGPDGEPAETGFCADVPVVTWDNFGQGFLIESCDACHGGQTPDRHGAPDAIVFDTESQAALMRELILAAATGDDPSMPPEGGVSDSERYLLEVWLRCYPPES